MRETPLRNNIMLDVCRGAVRLWINVVGSFLDPHRPNQRVTVGLHNPGGSDLIGWAQVTITPEMVGKTVAQFLAVEVKGDGTPWRPGQREFLQMVRDAGGRAGVARSVEDARKIVDSKDLSGYGDII
jgi:hypothetical protein